MAGLELIRQERIRQVNEEGHSRENDRNLVDGELALMAICYASPVQLYKQIRLELQDSNQCVGVGFKDPWPIEKGEDKRNKHDRIKQLSIAGALIAAELDRLLGEEDNDN